MAKIANLRLVFLVTIILGFSACEKESLGPVADDAIPTTEIGLRSGRPGGNLSLSFAGLEDLGSDYRYEGWIIVNGAPISTGIFSVNAFGQPSSSYFSLDQQDLDDAVAFVLTIEPYPDSDPAPSDVHILAGEFSNQVAELSIEHPAAIGTDFGEAVGNFILATPTNGPDSDENSGVWFLQFSGGGPVAGLSLPALPAGWIYEGWSVIDGIPVTTGKFSSAEGEDLAAPFSGPQPGPPFPGEDFLENAPAGLSFPLDLSQSSTVITVEPVPDNSPAPFLLKPLRRNVPRNAPAHTVFSLRNMSRFNNPAGKASRF